MNISLIQEIIDVIRLKKIKQYFNQNPMALRFVLNLCTLIEYNKRESNIQSNILRFIGCNVGKNVHIGANVHIYFPKNLTLEDNVWIGDNNVFMCWNSVLIKKNSITSTNVTFVAGSHNISDYSDVTTNQNIVVERGVLIFANATIIGGCTIAQGSVIACGSLCIEKKYNEMGIYAGVPIKKIKSRMPSHLIYQPVVYKWEELVNE